MEEEKSGHEPALRLPKVDKATRNSSHRYAHTDNRPGMGNRATRFPVAFALSPRCYLIVMVASYAQLVVPGSTNTVLGCRRALKTKSKVLGSNNKFVVLGLESTNEEQVQAAAQGMSGCLNTLVLAVLNQEDIRLVLWAYVNGVWTWFYDSNPMYMGCRVCSYAETSINTEGGEAQTLAELFGIPQQHKALAHWLVRRRGLGILYESERYAELARILGIPVKVVAR